MISTIRNEHGSALLIALAVILMVTVVAVVAVQRSTVDMTVSHNQVHEEKAFYLAEAGGKRGFAELNTHRVWRSGFNHEPFGEGTFSVRVVDSTHQPALHDTMVILSTGEEMFGKATVELTAIPAMENIFTYAMYADKGIHFDRNACTDSWDSDSGTYDATQADTAGDIGSNGTITSSQDVTIGGDISVATPGGIGLGADNIVTGDTTSTADSVELDIVPDWEYDWAEAVSSAGTGMSGSNYTYNAGKNTLVAGKDANIVLQSGVYYFSSITLGQNSAISLAPGATVKIYVTGDILLGQYSKINDGGTPIDCLIYSQGDLSFNQGNSFYACYYGPNAAIQYDQTTTVYGSLVGSTIQLDQGACFHYDRALSRVQRPLPEGVTLVAWRELN